MSTLFTLSTTITANATQISGLGDLGADPTLNFSSTALQIFFCYFANSTHMSFSLSHSAPRTLLVPIAAHSYHPLGCPAQGFLPTAGTETAASQSQPEECFWKNKNREKIRIWRISWLVVPVNGYYPFALRESTVSELKVRLFYFAEVQFLFYCFDPYDP